MVQTHDENSNYYNPEVDYTFTGQSQENKWQCCPKCNATGLIWNTPGWPSNFDNMSTAPYTCDVCNGKKIISSITGYPPQ